MNEARRLEAGGRESTPEADRGGSDARQPSAEGGGLKKVVTPTARREVVGFLRESFGRSERRACRAIGMNRSTMRYETRREDATDLRARLRELARRDPASGIGGSTSCFVAKAGSSTTSGSTGSTARKGSRCGAESVNASLVDAARFCLHRCEPISVGRWISWEIHSLQVERFDCSTSSTISAVNAS